MKVFFLNEFNKYDAIGIECLSSVIKQHGHQGRVFLIPDLVYNTTITLGWMKAFKEYTMISDEDFLRYLLFQKPDVLCFSMVTDYVKRSVQLAGIAKRLNPEVIIVAGGPHCTMCTEETARFPEFDYVCKGEGEKALVALLEALENNNRSPDIPGIYYRSNGVVKGSGIGQLVQNLDDIPFLDKEDVYRDYPFFERIYCMNTLRGCIYSCTYCGSPTLRDEYKAAGVNVIRRKSVGSVIKELVQARQKFRKMGFVGFADDVFTWPAAWAKEFSREYKKYVGLPFFMCTNPVLFKDEELVRSLKEAGLAYVELGVQAIDEGFRMKEVKRPDTDKDITACAGLMRKYGIYFQMNHIFGLDRRDLTDEAFLRETAEYYLRLRPNRTHCFELEFLPGSRELELALEEKRISRQDYERIFKGDVSCAYNFGGSITDRKIFTPYVLFLELAPFLPKAVSRAILHSAFWFEFIKKIPLSYIILTRILNTTIFDRRDIGGRPHYRKYIDGVRYIVGVKKQLRRTHEK
jgi:anaerobic magnesium-protoporphyrin IX monomethyl ester cyclase